MEKQELNKILVEVITEKVSKGIKAMANKPKCRKMYDDMIAEGFKEQAECFHKIVLLSCILHPEKTDEEILQEFLNNVLAKK